MAILEFGMNERDNKTGLPFSILRKANFRTEKGQKRFSVTRMANSQKWQKISKFGHKLPKLVNQDIMIYLNFFVTFLFWMLNFGVTFLFWMLIFWSLEIGAKQSTAIHVWRHEMGCAKTNKSKENLCASSVKCYCNWIIETVIRSYTHCVRRRYIEFK